MLPLRYKPLVLLALVFLVACAAPRQRPPATPTSPPPTPTLAGVLPTATHPIPTPYVDTFILARDIVERARMPQLDGWRISPCDGTGAFVCFAEGSADYVGSAELLAFSLDNNPDFLRLMREAGLRPGTHPLNNAAYDQAARQALMGLADSHLATIEADRAITYPNDTFTRLPFQSVRMGALPALALGFVHTTPAGEVVERYLNVVGFDHQALYWLGAAYDPASFNSFDSDDRVQRAAPAFYQLAAGLPLPYQPGGLVGVTPTPPPSATPTATNTPPPTATPTPAPVVVHPTSVEFILALTDVNIRSGPGQDYPVVGWVAGGQVARVTGVNSAGSWWRVICPDNTIGSCWITAAAQYTRPTSSPQPPTPTPIAVHPTNVNFIMALTDVNIRSGPSQSYNILGQIFGGQIARVTGINSDGTWWRVICPDSTVGSCWVTASLLFTRPTDGPTVPTATPTPQNCQDAATFLADVTVPDYTRFTPGAPFRKTWRVRNSGTCTWTTQYSLYFVSGDAMSGPASVPFPATVTPGQTIDLSVNLVAPGDVGRSTFGNWRLRNDKGENFGVGRNNAPLTVVIVIVSPEPAPRTPPITGTVFNDYCEVFEQQGGSGIPVGNCVFDGVRYRANGLLDSGESGIAGVTVFLIAGSCPSGAPQVATAVTDSRGGYRFENLLPGDYCVTVQAAHPANSPILLPGEFTAPALNVGYFNLPIFEGQPTVFADFGWDYQLR